MEGSTSGQIYTEVSIFSTDIYNKILKIEITKYCHILNEGFQKLLGTLKNVGLSLQTKRI